MISVSEVVILVGVLDAALNGATRLAASIGSRVTSATVSRWDSSNEEGVTPNTAHSLQSSGLGSSVFGQKFSRRETYGPVTSARKASFLYEFTFDFGHRRFISRTFSRHNSSRVSVPAFFADIRAKYSATWGRTKGLKRSIFHTPPHLDCSGNNPSILDDPTRRGTGQGKSFRRADHR